MNTRHGADAARPGRRKFLATTGLATAGWLTGVRAEEKAPPASTSGSFFFVSDTHYCAEEMTPEVLKPASREVTTRLVDTLNRLPGTALPAPLGGGTVPEPLGVIHGGDLIDSGDKGTGKVALARVATELAAWQADFGANAGDGRLKWALREVHGNHDSPGGTGPVIDALRARTAKRQGLSAVAKNGLHCSWDWGGVHFVALGLIVGTTPAVTRRRRYAALESLAFLQEDLRAHVGTSGKPVVIVHHVDMPRYSTPVPDDVAVKNEWDHADVAAYHAALQPYRVAAILYGHTHVRNIYRWNGTKDTKATRGVPSFNADNASHFKDKRQAFLHFEFDSAELRVREFATQDAWQTGIWTPQLWRFPLGAA